MPETAAISVILISRNRSAQLPHVLRAIAAGTVRPDEVLLADDASTDDTPGVFTRLCEDLGLAGRTLTHEPAERPFRLNTLRNAGLQAARNERAVILDADVVVAPTHLAAHARMLDRGAETISTGPRLEYARADATGPVDYMWGHEPYSLIQDDPATPLPFWGLVPACNMGLHVALAERVGWFDPDYDGAYGYDDADFTYRASRQGAFFAGAFDAHVVHIPHETVFGHRIGAENRERFRRKHGFDFAYPAFFDRVTHRENWAVRYARSLAGREESADELALLGPAPAAGIECVRMTRWAARNVGGRFLLKLAGGKLWRRLRGKRGDDVS